ncbi:MAG: hypothetical protein U9Q33_10780 [Campylobacterota bacterium]|nr:hypothetical protein [Campylobacterota bacterium]
MKKTFKLVVLSSIISTFLFASDNNSSNSIVVDSIGLNLGKLYSDHSQKNHNGIITVTHHPYKNHTGAEIYLTLNGVFDEDDLKPYFSISHSNNDDMTHDCILAGVNKYYKHDHFDIYAGVLGGYGQLDWGYDPINGTKDNNYDANSFIIGLQGGVEYPIDDTLSLGVNAKYLLHDYETQLEPSNSFNATVTHDKTIFLGLGINMKFGEEKKRNLKKSKGTL